MNATQLKSNTGLTTTKVSFDDMLQNGFGIVTVMKARVYTKPIEDLLNLAEDEDLSDKKVYDIINTLLALDNTNYIKLDTLKIANINQEGPTKTITGGQTGSALLKYGKTATIEIQDALGKADALELLGGATIETFKVEGKITEGNTKVIHFGDQFGGPKPILGESFFVDQKSGKQIKVYILIYEMLPDSIFNLTQDAEGDATVFDMNGSLNSKEICIGTDETSNDKDTTMNVFYSILPKIAAPTTNPSKPPQGGGNGGQGGSGQPGGEGGQPGGEGGQPGEAGGQGGSGGTGGEAGTDGKDPVEGEPGGGTV